MKTMPPTRRVHPLPPFRHERICQPELLDEIPAVAATPNLADMVRINRLFGGFRILRNEIRALVAEQTAPRILDVGAGGTGTARWLRAAFPQAEITSTDLRADLLAVGDGPRVAADALALPFCNECYDVVVSTLFLHHLPGAAIPTALEEMLRVSRLGVVAVDLLRHPLAYRFLPLTQRLFGWHEVTVIDGTRSVQAALTVDEMQQLVREAGLAKSIVRAHHPWFRLSVRIAR